MKKFLSCSLCIIVMLLVSLSCRKSESYNISYIPVVPYDPGAKITPLVAGTISDESSNGLSDVSVSKGTTVVTTDANGRFIIPKASLYKKAGLVLATKDGYFGGSRTIYPKENVINNVTIQLIKKISLVALVAHREVLLLQPMEGLFRFRPMLWLPNRVVHILAL